MRVAAAIGAPKPGRRWVDRGHLNIVRPADPGSVPASCRDGSQSASGRECLPWRQRVPLERIVLPAGFAPLSDARIEKVGGGPAPGVASSQAPANDRPEKPAAPEPAGVPAVEAAGGPTAAVARPEPASISAASAGTAVATGTAAAPASDAQARAAPSRPEWVSVVEAKDLSEVGESHAEPSESKRSMLWAWLGGLAAIALVAIALALTPRLRSGELGPALVRAAKHLRAARRVSTRRMVEAARRSTPRLSAVRDRLGDRLAGLRARPEHARDVETVTTEPAPEQDPAMASVAWQAATLFDEIERAVQGLAPSTPLRVVLEDELASINQRLVVTRAASLDGGSPVKAVSQYRALVRELERVRRIANSAAASLAGARMALAIPTTKGEAYQLLGVNPDVSEGILKKIVDALRMTWHPDHARDEQDRLLREDRIKQINIAWDLINDKRAAA